MLLVYYMYMHTYVCVCMYTCMTMCTYVYTCMYNVCTHVCVCMYMYACVCIHVYILAVVLTPFVRDRGGLIHGLYYYRDTC